MTGGRRKKEEKLKKKNKKLKLALLVVVSVLISFLFCWLMGKLEVDFNRMMLFAIVYIVVIAAFVIVWTPTINTE